MRNKKAKRIRKQIYGDMPTRLEGRKYKAQSIAGVATGAVVSVGLRAKYQASKLQA